MISLLSLSAKPTAILTRERRERGTGLVERMLRRLSSSLRSLTRKFSKSEECNVVIVGLDNAGKSTIINAIKMGKESTADREEVAPTVGFRVETLSRSSLNITVFDMSGQDKYRNLWEKHFSQVHGVIFVVDSSDRMRMCVARDELEMILENTTMKDSDIPMLFLANKMDAPDHVSAAECVSQLGLEGIQERPWFIVSTNALTGEGLDEAFDWLADNVVALSAEEKKCHK